MVSSLTLHSWTNCAASKSNKPHPRSYQKTFLKKYIISNSSKICVTTSKYTWTETWGSKKTDKKPKIFFRYRTTSHKDETMGIRSCKFSDLNFSEIMAKMEL